jgi:transposase
MATTSPTYRLSDAQWEQIEGFLPANGHKGGQWKDHRRMIDGILWALSDGGRWRNLPAEFGPWQTVYDRFRKWCRTGLWDRILLHLQARKMRAGEIDWDLFCIDGSVIRAHQSAAGAAKKKSAAGRAGGPRPGPQPGGLRHQAAPDLRRRGHADRGGGRPRPGA